MLDFLCGCGRMLRANERDAGQEARCPVCLGVSPIPGVADGHAPRPLALPDPDAPGLPDLRKHWVVGRIAAVCVGLLTCIVLGAFLLPPVQKARVSSASGQERNNLRQCADSLLTFESVYGAAPRSIATRGPGGEPLLSWRVAVLPYLEQDHLFKQFRLDEPWDSPHNKALLPQMPKTYASVQGNDGEGMTRILAVVGAGCVFDEAESFEKVPPGQLLLGRALADPKSPYSGAVMLVTGAKAVPWTKPEDFDAGRGGIASRLDTRFGGITQAVTLGGQLRRHPASDSAKWAAAFRGTAPLGEERLDEE
jgi:hypothetical protein